MKVRLQPGAELDLLSESELRRALEEVKRGLTLQPAIIRGEADTLLDASGVGGMEVYKPPQGMSFKLTRLLVDADGSNAGAPFTAAAAWLAVRRNGQEGPLVDFRSLVAGAISPAGLPQLFTYGADSAAAFLNGDAVFVRIVNGPASVNLRARFEGLLSPFDLGN